MKPLRIFIGVDHRQAVGFNVLQWSLHRHSKARLQIEPLMLHKLPMGKRGLTEFTFSRFLPPWLCDYEGVCAFMDADVVVTGDIADLFAQADGVSSVQVMKDQPKFEWPSVMLFNNANCKMLTPEWLDRPDTKPLALDWGDVGTFSAEWNHCVGYMKPKTANLYHYTQGLPCWPETRGHDEDVHWHEALRDMTHTVSWRELMGGSVHARPVLMRMFEKYGVKVSGNTLSVA